MATPPPFLCTLASLLKLKLGGVDTIRTAAMLDGPAKFQHKNIKIKIVLDIYGVN